jgi:hypothetical protein
MVLHPPPVVSRLGWCCAVAAVNSCGPPRSSAPTVKELWPCSSKRIKTACARRAVPRDRWQDCWLASPRGNPGCLADRWGALVLLGLPRGGRSSVFLAAGSAERMTGLVSTARRVSMACLTAAVWTSPVRRDLAPVNALYLAALGITLCAEVPVVMLPYPGSGCASGLPPWPTCSASAPGWC